MALLKNRSNISHFPLFFIVLRCQMLFPPLNGFVEGECDNTYGSTCKMMCNDGYNLLGSDILTCLKKPGHITGYWDNPVPVCKSKCQIGLLAIVSRCQYTYPFRFVFISRKKKSFKFLSYIGPMGPDQQRSTVVDYLLRGETGKNIVDYQEESELAQS